PGRRERLAHHRNRRRRRRRPARSRSRTRPLRRALPAPGEGGGAALLHRAGVRGSGARARPLAAHGQARLGLRPRLAARRSRDAEVIDERLPDLFLEAQELADAERRRLPARLAREHPALAEELGRLLAAPTSFVSPIDASPLGGLGL